MAQEAIKVELYGDNCSGDIRRYAVASNATIAKGTLLTLTADRTVTATTAEDALFAGIAAADKKNDDYATTIPAWTNGVFDLVASMAVTFGDQVGTGTCKNSVTSNYSAVISSHANVVGYALESAASGARCNVRVLV